MIKTNGFIKCIGKDCGKVKRFSKERFPVEIYDWEGNFKGRLCYDCTHKKSFSQSRGWGNVDFGKLGKKGKRKNRHKEVIEADEFKEYFAKEEA